MYELKTNTATRIAVGPLVDPTDGITAEIDPLTVTDLSVQIYQIKTDGTDVVRTQFAPTAISGGNDMILVPSSTDGMYDLELTAAQLNFYGNARLSLYDVDGFLVHYVDLQVVSANYFDNKFGVTIENVNATQISGDSTAANNLELDYDGTGYAKANSTIGTVTANSDKTGYALSATGIDAVVMSDLAAVPAATATLKAAVNWIFEMCRNKQITNKTNNEIEVYKDDAATKFAESDISDTGTVFTRGEFGTPD